MVFWLLCKESSGNKQSVSYPWTLVEFWLKWHSKYNKSTRFTSSSSSSSSELERRMGTSICSCSDNRPSFAALQLVFPGAATLTEVFCICIGIHITFCTINLQPDDVAHVKSQVQIWNPFVGIANLVFLMRFKEKNELGLTYILSPSGSPAAWLFCRSC